MIKFFLTNHAKLRAKMRNVDYTQIESTLENPDSIKSGRDNTQIAIKTFNGKRLFVIYEYKDEKYVVITIYFRT